MKKLAIIFVGIFISLGFKEDYKNSERQQNSAFTVIFMSSDSYDYKNNKSYPCAQPIVVYINGKYIEPPDCIKDDDGVLINDNNQCNNYSRFIQPFIKRGARLYELDNGIQNNIFTVQRTGVTGAGREIHCGILNSKPMHTFLTNNQNVGTRILAQLEISDRPILKKRKDCLNYGSPSGGMMYCTDRLMSKVDIDGDGFPELIYENEVTEGYYITIYSKKNNRWVKVFEGSGDGV
jgi:hypothetical protein